MLVHMHGSFYLHTQSFSKDEAATWDLKDTDHIISKGKFKNTVNKYCGQHQEIIKIE